MRVISFQIMILAMFQVGLIFGLTHCASDDQAEQMEEVVQGEGGEEAGQVDEEWTDQSESSEDGVASDQGSEESLALEEGTAEEAEMEDEMEQADANDVATSEAQDAIAESLVEAVDSETEPSETFEPAVPETEYATESGFNTTFTESAPATETFTSTEYPNDTSAAASGDRRSYIVQPGDSLSRIASRVYGNQDKWRELANINGLNNPNRIFPGDKIYYPSNGSTQAFSNRYDALPRQNVTVKRGDTLAIIASNVYSDSGAWKSLWRQNEDKVSNPNFIQVGQVLRYIPAEAWNSFMGNPEAPRRNPAPAMSNNTKKTQQPVAAPAAAPDEDNNIQDVIDTDLGLEE